MLHEHSKATIHKYTAQLDDKGRKIRKKVQNIIKLNINILSKFK